jgi:hypothetical protein
MKETLRQAIGILKCKFHKATMSPAQLELYDAMGKTWSSDQKTETVTVTIPAGASEGDLKKVKKQFTLEGGSWPITYVQAPPAAPVVPAAPPAEPPKPQA